jgi:hypothetical protein
MATVTFNNNFKNDVLDSFDATFNSGTLTIRTGASPGAGNAASGTVLATITLPADAFAAAVAGSKAKQSTWEDTSADASGDAGHFRLTNGAATRVVDGDITVTGGGGAMEVDSIEFTAGQSFTITAFTFSI